MSKGTRGTSLTPTLKPDQADFAILDLAQHEEGVLLGWLYSYFGHQEIPWTALYYGTEIKSGWATGPILIETRGFSDFQKALIERYQTAHLGVLIHAPNTSLAPLAEHLRSLITVRLDDKFALFRFYDPRCLGALVEILDSVQRQRLNGPAERWSWHQHQHWWQWEVQENNTTQVIDEPLVITADQRLQIDNARSRQFAQSLSRRYQGHIPGNDAVGFVMNEVQAAALAGLENLADQERWLRMALHLQQPLKESRQWKDIAWDSAKTAAQVLSQLECEQGRNAC